MRAAAVLLVLLGCSGSDGLVAEPLALEDFGPAMKRAVCDWAVRCRHVPNRPTCERLVDPSDFDTRRAADAIAAGRLAFDPALGGACVRETRDQACLSLPYSALPCLSLFAGRVPLHEPCTSSFECAEGFCELTECGAQCCTGTCVPDPGGDVEFPPPAQIGERCTGPFDCEPDAYCEENGRCAPLPTEVGQRCLFGCASGDLYCDLDALICRRYAGANEACSPDGVSAPPCDEAWSYCALPPGAELGTCRPRPGIGDWCQLEGPAACIPTTYCDGSRCQPRGRAGAPCADQNQCSVACDASSGRCVSYQTCEID